MSADCRASAIEVTLLDRAGVIVAVNQAWQEFCQENGGDPARTGVGTSYLGVCAAARDDPEVRRIEAAVQAAVRGELPAPMPVVVPCHRPGRSRWFEMWISSRFDDAGECLGATVALAPMATVPDHRSAGRPTVARTSAAGSPTLDDSAIWELVAAAPDGQLLVDVTGRIAFVNPQLEAISGFPRAELLGQPVEVLLPEGARDAHRGLREAYVQAPRSRMMGHGTTLEMNRHDGSILAVEVSLAPVTVTGSLMIAASVRDVTVQRAADNERRRLLALIDLVPDAVFVHDAELRIEYANQAMADWLGYPRSVLVGMTADQIYPALDAPDAGAVLAAIAAKGPGQPTVSDCVLRHRSGTELPAEARVQAILDDGGAARFVVVARDVRERRERESRLRISEEFFRAAFERAPIGMAVSHVDEAGRREIERANQALADLLGTTVEGLAGHDLARFSDQDDESADTAAAAEMALGRRAEYRRRKRYRREDGRMVWAELRSSSVLRGDRPDAATVLTHLVDVTDQYELERRRSRQALLVSRVAEATSALLAGATPEDLFADLARAAAEVAEADNATLVLSDRETGEPVRVAVVGATATWMKQHGMPFSPQLLEAVHQSGSAVGFPAPPIGADPRLFTAFGPIAGAPVVVGGGRHGLLAVARPPHSDPFSALDLDQLARLASQVSLAIEVADARADRQRLALLEDRQRIARDLHDTVIQDLIAIGMQLSSRLGRELDQARRERDSDLIDQLDGAIRRLRSVVFSLREAARSSGLAEEIRTIVTEAARVLGHQPGLTISGPVEQMPETIQEQLTAVLREALSNIARHADATATEAALSIDDDRLTLVVSDNGRGIRPDSIPGNGLANIRERARALGGEATFASDPQGTTLTWTCAISGR